MTSLTPHASPKWTRVLNEQLHVTGFSLRLFLLALLLVAGMIDAITIAMAAQAGKAAGELTRRHLPNQGISVGYSPEMAVIVVPIALMLAILLWMDEDADHRDYHWTMPVDRASHSLIKVLAGWIWLMALTLLLIVNVTLLTVATNGLQGLPQGFHDGSRLWEYLVPFTSATVAYAFASAAAVGARRPFVWIGGVPLLYMGIAGFLVGRFGPHFRFLLKAWSGVYGASAVLGDVRYTDTGVPSVMRWLGSFGIWAALGAALLILVAYRRPDPR